MYIKTTGLVLRETLYKESSKLLNVLTPDMGRITVSAKGVRRRGSKTAASAQLLAYSEMTLAEGKVGYTLTEARCIEMFEGLRSDLTLLSLGSYFAEALETVSDSDSADEELLSLGLNSLYALSRGLRHPSLIKPAFETRLMCVSGFEPSVDICAVCGREDVQSPRLSLTGGVVRCAACRMADFGKCAELCEGSLSAMRHVIRAEPKRIFSFTIGTEAGALFYSAAENYMLAQLDRGFKTLDFYRSIS